MILLFVLSRTRKDGSHWWTATTSDIVCGREEAVYFSFQILPDKFRLSLYYPWVNKKEAT